MAAGAAAPSTSTATSRACAAGPRTRRSCATRGSRSAPSRRRRRPALDPVYEPVRDRFAGALHAPGDESGDARLFTRNLALTLRGRGVTFRMGEEVRKIESSGPHVRRLVTDKGEVEADAYVLAAGCASPRLGRLAHLHLPIYPVKGYSVTLPIEGRNNPPTLSGVDEDNLFAFANYGDRVRLTAIAEFAGYDTSHKPQDFATVLRAARELFPDAGNYDRPEYGPACAR